MDCLLNYIAPYYGCDAPTPASGMYLSQLPGIEFAQFQDIASADQITWVQTWNDIQATAAQNFREDVIAEFGKRYQLRQILQTVDLEKGIDANTTCVPVAGTQNGFLIETFQNGQQCIGSNLMQLYVQEINFYYNGTAGSKTFTVNLIDADSQVTVFVKTVTGALAGWNNVWIDQGFSARRLYVLVTGNFDSYVLEDISLFNLQNFSSGYGNWGWSDNYLFYNWNSCGLQSRVRGVQFTSAINIAVTGINTFGVSAVFSTKCMWDNVVCANKKHFASAWQYRLAIDMMDFRINSSRINRWTTVSLEQAKKLQTHFSLKYTGNALITNSRNVEELTGNIPVMGKLQNAIASIVINDVDGCIKMDNYLMWRESTL